MKNLKAIIALIWLMAGINSASSQTVGISADPANTANSKAILDLDGVFGTDYRGMLLPRMTNAQKVTYGGTLVAADEGMTIYNITNDQYEFWNGTQWVILATTANVSSSTLDDAYNAGGSGLGRTITADNGAVEILGNDGLYVNGDVEVNSLAGTGNRPVHVDANGVLQTNSAISRIDPLYVRGTGLNHNSNRVLKIGSTEVYNTTGRGLRLTIIAKSNHAVLSDVVYDTYGSAAAATNLATALNGVGNSDIGILTSFDAWEGQVNAALRTAFQRLGLYKALMTVGGSRKTYAAVFEGSSSASAPSVSVVEVEHSDNGNQPYSEIRGWLIDGAFVANSQVPSGLSTPIGAFAVGVNESGNVGIGTIAPAEELHVIGDIRSSALAGGGNVEADANGNLIVSTSSGDSDYIHNQNALDQAANFRINGWGETYGLKINAPDGEKIQFTNAGANGSKIRHSTGWAIDYHAGPGNSGVTGSHRFYTTAQNIYRERLGIESTGRVNIRQDIGNDPAFTGLESPETASGRAQLVLSSSYSDLVIASSEGNNNHGSTLTFATYNPANANEYRKFVVNQGNWGARAGFLDFGFANAGGRANPHLNINATDNVVTMDGYNKRVGIYQLNPQARLHVRAAGNDNPANNGIYVYNEDTGGDNDDAIVTARVNGASAGDPFISMDVNGVTGWSVGLDNSDGDKLKFANSWSNVGTNTRMTLQTDGNLGIGTATPSFKLHVPSGYIGTDYINTSDNSQASGVTGVMVKAGDNYLRTGTAASIATFLNTTGTWIPNNGIGDYQIASSSTSTAYPGATLELRESNFTANGSATPPHLGFHWGGVVASNIAIEASGRIAIRDNPGTAYEDFVADGMTGSRFTDLNDGGYYTDPNGTSRMYYGDFNYLHTQVNDSWFPFTGNGYNYFRGQTYAWNAVWYDENDNNYQVDPNGETHLNVLRANILYDHNDAGYYLDPNSTSREAERIRGGTLHGPNVGWGDYLSVGASGREWIDNADVASVATTNGNLHLDASSGHGSYINWYDGDFLYVGNGSGAQRALMNGDGLYLYDGWLRTHGNNGLYFQDHGTGIHSALADGGQYGSVSTHGATGGWEGFSIDGRYVFMGQDNGQEWGIYNDVDNIWSILYNRLATDNGFRFFNSWSGALNMRIQHTNGGSYASYDGDNNWDFYSDRRLKENIENEENILDRLLKLDVVNYDFIEQERTEAEKEKGIIDYSGKEKEIGFIAQEVEKLFPSLVSETEDERYDFKVKALGYSSFGVLAIGGIKELKIEKDAEIQELKTEVEELKNLVKELLENQK